MALKKEVSELRAKLASQEEDYHKSEGEMHAEVLNEHELMELTFKQKRWLEQGIPCPCCSMYNLLGIVGFKDLSGFILSWAGCLGECSR